MSVRFYLLCFELIRDPQHLMLLPQFWVSGVYGCGCVLLPTDRQPDKQTETLRRYMYTWFFFCDRPALSALVPAIPLPPPSPCPLGRATGRAKSTCPWSTPSSATSSSRTSAGTTPPFTTTLSRPGCSAPEPTPSKEVSLDRSRGSIPPLSLPTRPAHVRTPPRFVDAGRQDVGGDWVF